MQPHQASRRGRGSSELSENKTSVRRILVAPPSAPTKYEDGGTITPIMQTGGGFGELAHGHVLGRKGR